MGRSPPIYSSVAEPSSNDKYRTPCPSAPTPLECHGFGAEGRLFSSLLEGWCGRARQGGLMYWAARLAAAQGGGGEWAHVWRPCRLPVPHQARERARAAHAQGETLTHPPQLPTHGPHFQSKTGRCEPTAHSYRLRHFTAHPVKP